MSTTKTITTSMENYLEAIYLLIRDHTVARSKDIASHLKVKRASVSGALHNLKDQGFVKHEPYGYVTLTREGAEIARRILNRHEALRDFMVNVLSIDEAEADEAACHMEHGISKHIVERFVEFAEFFKRCPSAGAEWTQEHGYQCSERTHSTANCERCGNQCSNRNKKTN